MIYRGWKTQSFFHFFQRRKKIHKYTHTQRENTRKQKSLLSFGFLLFGTQQGYTFAGLQKHNRTERTHAQETIFLFFTAHKRTYVRVSFSFLFFFRMFPALPGQEPGGVFVQTLLLLLLLGEIFPFALIKDGVCLLLSLSHSHTH